MTVCIKTAHYHAIPFLETGTKEYSQWFPGHENNVADALSCDFDRSDIALTQILCDTNPLQLPQPSALSHSTAAQLNQLVSHEGAVTGGKHENHARLWHRFSR